MDKIRCEECGQEITEAGLADALDKLQGHALDKHEGRPVLFRIVAGPNSPRVKIAMDQLWRDLRHNVRPRYWVVWGEHFPNRVNREPGLWRVKPFNDFDEIEVRSEEQIWRNCELVCSDYRDHLELQEGGTF